MKTTGFSLIEVLISLFLLSLLLLGLAAVQIDAIRQARALYFFTIATQQLSNIRERLHQPLTAEDFTAAVAAWNNENQTVLPHGQGNVAGASPHYQLTIIWNNQGEIACIKEAL